jgi:AmmeMemoRadiSam system protein B
MSNIRSAAVAGAFYPADPASLRLALACLLAKGAVDGLAVPAGSGEAPPKMIVMPHAGYSYSGDVAALACAPLARWLRISAHRDRPFRHRDRRIRERDRPFR